MLPGEAHHTGITNIYNVHTVSRTSKEEKHYVSESVPLLTLMYKL